MSESELSPVDRIRQKMRRYTVFALIATAVLSVFGGAVATQAYLRANDILADATVVDAQIVDSNVYTETRKGGREVDVYEFTYQFDVDGKTFTKLESGPQKFAEKYIEAGEITIAYSNADPSEFDRHLLLERQADLVDTIVRTLMVTGFIALFFIVIGVLVKRRLMNSPEVRALRQPS